ncbi:hypothetical protein [Mangrovibacter phragmitis]|uniref:hypothetical protein n=1 Tax=Mangrovibacter phragmitis TaxID=1691903 RepID=UPI0035155312
MNIKMLLTSTVLALASFTAASYAQAATTQYCNPNYHSCEAPFNLNPGQIAKKTGSTSHYCNPNYHSCEAPFNL